MVILLHIKYKCIFCRCISCNTIMLCNMYSSSANFSSIKSHVVSFFSPRSRSLSHRSWDRRSWPHSACLSNHEVGTRATTSPPIPPCLPSLPWPDFVSILPSHRSLRSVIRTCPTPDPSPFVTPGSNRSIYTAYVDPFLCVTRLFSPPVLIFLQIFSFLGLGCFIFLGYFKTFCIWFFCFFFRKSLLILDLNLVVGFFWLKMTLLPGFRPNILSSAPRVWRHRRWTRWTGILR